MIITSYWRTLSLAVLLAGIVSFIPAYAQSPTEALFQAVELNDIERLEEAISAGADLTSKNDEGMTPADVAVDLGHFRIAHILLARRTSAPPSPRVTEKADQALMNPRNRLPAAPRTGAATPPSPRLSGITPPMKPRMQQTKETSPEDTPIMVQPTPQPKATPSPTAPKISPRPDDEIAGSPETDRSSTQAAEAADPTQETSSFLDNVWGGLKDVVTLGGLIGGDEKPNDSAAPSSENQSAGLSSPADRFRPQTKSASESSAGRMVDRLTGMVDGDQPRENEFGLPEGPVVQLPEEMQTGDIPGLAAPVESANGLPPLSAPGSPEDLPDLAVVEPLDSVPGITPSPEELMSEGVPGRGISEVDDQTPGLLPPELPNGPAPPDPSAELFDPETPGSENIPGLAAPQLPSENEIPELEIPGLPTAEEELDIPGLATPNIPGVTPADEVPGILPPPGGLVGDIPGLPPGLEPLPGSTTGQLRRPDGLVEPEDPSVLPAPGSQSLASRLQRIDDVLNRTPTLNERGRARMQRGARSETGPLTATAPRKAPVQVGEPDPLMEIPKGLERTQSVTRKQDIVQRQQSRQERIKRAEQEPIRDKSAIRKPRRLTGHELSEPAEPITGRDDPSTRMIERIARIGRGSNQEEDVHGLPVARPPTSEVTAPRRDIVVSEGKQQRREQADERIHALARFFRGDQEEENGMTPPESEVVSEPLPKVIDNLIAENDPARGRVVDDRLLDLEGVENANAVATKAAEVNRATGNGRLNSTFLDKLTTVLSPTTRQTKGVSQPIPERGTIGVDELDIPKSQTIAERNPTIPDPWTMTVEKKDGGGGAKTLGVTAVSPTDGSELQRQEGVVTQMVGRIRELLVGPREARPDGPSIDSLDDGERQEAAERLLSDALRDGPPTALPDAGAWSVTEVEAQGGVPGVPPKPRPGVLSRTSLEDVILSIGESVTLANTLPPQQDGVDPLNECVKKNRGTTLFCVEPVDWPDELRAIFTVPTILYTGPMAITRYDQGTPSRFHSLFSSGEFEKVVAYFQSRYGEPTEIWKRSIAPLAKPRMDNPTVTWRSRDRESNVISVLEIRKFDDTRGGFPDTTRGAVMLYYLNAPSIFPQVSSHELMRLRRTR